MEKSSSAYIETGKDEKPEQQDPYFDLRQTIANHGKSEDGGMMSSVNSESGKGINGGGTPHRGQPSIGGK